MLLEDKILNDYKEAMKAKDALKVSILSFLRSQFMNVRIDKRKDKLGDGDVVVVVKKLIKQHQDSIKGFKAGNRQDLVEKETRESEILKTYLPEELGLEQVKQIIDEVVTSLGATTMKDMGRVMKEVMAKTAGRADSKIVSDTVKEKLTPQAP